MLIDDIIVIIFLEPLSPKDKLSYSDALVGNFTHKKLKLETYRGKRRLQPISIETFAMEANLEHTGTLDSNNMFFSRNGSLVVVPS